MPSHFILRRGQMIAEVTERAAALRVLRHGTKELVTSWPADGPIPYYSGTLLAPWPNRVGGAAYSFGGETHRLPVNEADRGNALHGLVAAAVWEAVEAAPDTVRLAHTIAPSPGYPFTLTLDVRYVLSRDGLTTTLTAENTGRRPAPYGCGPHPWLLAGDGRAGDWELEVPAGKVLLVDDRLLPKALADVAGTPYDFRVPRPPGVTAVDHAFTSIASYAGRSRVRMRDPRRGDGVEIGWDPAVMPWVQVCTGSGLGHAGIAVEPMTCPPDAFNTGTDLVVLPPGGRHEASWTISPL